MKFGFLVFPGAEELDLVGPWELAAMWHKIADGPECVIVAETTEPVVCAKGMSINPHVSFEECPKLDYLLVPGGRGTRTEVQNARLLDFVRRQARDSRAVLSVCTGAFVLQAAGLLSGKRATTHWESLDRLRAFPDVSIVEERFVRDDTVWTSAGVSAGMDLLLEFMASEAGVDAAGEVQLAAEYFPAGTRYGTVSTRNPKSPAYVRTKRLELPDCGVSLRIPRGWTIERASSEIGTASSDLTISAPKESGYRSSVTFTRENLEPPTPEQFESVIKAVYSEFEKSPDIEIRSEGRANQNSMPAWIMRYTRHAAAASHPFEQILLLLVTDLARGTMLQIDASTITPLAEVHVPILMSILESLEPLGHTGS